MESKTLKKFKEYSKQIELLRQAANLFNWDLETLSPEGGKPGKIEAISHFATEIFKLETAPEYGEMLDALSTPKELSALPFEWQQTITREREDYQKNLRVPADFITEYSAASALSNNVWKEAKQKDDFSLFAPHLEKMIQMGTEYAGFLEPEKDTYDAMLDMFELGVSAADIDKAFGELKEGLIPFIRRIEEKEAPDLSALTGTYPAHEQRALEKFLLDYIGFDFGRGTVGETEHPFTTTICMGDVRVSNHFHEDNPLSAIFSAIHEGGHAIFEQNINPEYAGTRASRIEGLMGLHESQSRFFENILGRNFYFWKPIYKKAAEILPALNNVPFETFCLAINTVRPSFIRINADEVTYCLHIVLRHEMEQAIFKEHIPVDELPGLWDDKMESLLGIRPKSAREGILQDMHWSAGNFGYFPSYLLGSIYDGMFLRQLGKDLGSVDEILAAGKIRDITAWLNKNIHQYGGLYNSKEVLKRVCDADEISAEPLLDYFNKKYSRIYGF